ncbi:MAG: hypothetical protein GYB67_17850 [Chloroflexi bacterium]|nr:hypothetical protein [Chloroflexota bacterium]
MDLSTTVLLTVIIGSMFLFIQRAEPKRRLLVAVITLLVGVLVRNYTFYRDVHTEAWVALGAALLLNFLFWLLIGRYNPVSSSDEIQVIGMDD